MATILSEDTIQGLFVGPAVIIDDRFDDPGANMTPVIDQIRELHIPLITQTKLPPAEEVKHWRDFSLIVLDWELFSGEESLPPGISAPEGLSTHNDIQVSAFVEVLLEQLFCPIFIFSNGSVEAIWDQLKSRTTKEESYLRSRILVKSKSDVSDNLFSQLGEWLGNHQAMYALKCWEQGYASAKRSLFEELQNSSISWPGLLWQTSQIDTVNPNWQLADTISRNILHRLPAIVFDSSIFQVSSEGQTSGADLRRVIHRQSVISRNHLHDDVLMPGDFFFDLPEEGDPPRILINMTPACDMVQRGSDSVDSLRMMLIRADLVSEEDQSNKSKRERLYKEDEANSQIITVLNDSARPYRIRFRSWISATWGEYKLIRQGRLLEPHITQLQQKFALHLHRQGLPKLPDNYYYVPGGIQTATNGTPTGLKG